MLETVFRQSSIPLRALSKKTLRQTSKSCNRLARPSHSRQLHSGGVIRRFISSSAEMAKEIGTDQEIDQKYRPFLIGEKENHEDWITQEVLQEGGLLEVKEMMDRLPRKIRVLILYGSLRERSFSRLMAYEAARLMHHLGADVRVYSPRGLPLKDDCEADHDKVQELREMMAWSDTNFWCSPEQHGNITGIFKTMIDHIPLSTGSVRPTQGKILAVSQVNGGSQSFNAVNSLRILGRWMRMITIPNQASLPKAWTQFDEKDRMMPSSNRERLVDVVEELMKFSCLLAGKEDLLSSRWSERKEREDHGRLRTQEEKETKAKSND